MCHLVLYRALALTLVMAVLSACGPAPEASDGGDQTEGSISVEDVTSPGFAALPADLLLEAPTEAYAADIVTAPQAAASVDSITLVPRDAGQAPTAEQLLAAYRTCQDSQDRPRTLADLTGGYKLFQSSYKERVAASLGIIGAGDVSGNRNAMAFQYHLYRYVGRNCVVNTVTIPVVWGVGVASTLHIKEVSGGAKTNSLPGVAASVEFGRASVSMRLETPGMVGDPIEDVLPSAESVANFDVKSYGTWAVALDKIRALMSDPGVTITPQLLITAEALPSIVRAFRP